MAEDEKILATPTLIKHLPPRLRRIIGDLSDAEKVLMTTEFIAGGVSHEERRLLFGFAESRDQRFRNAAGWGVDFERMEKDGLLNERFATSRCWAASVCRDASACRGKTAKKTLPSDK